MAQIEDKKPNPSTETILDRWGVSAEELTQLVDENPSLRGILMGYVAELKLTHLLAVDAHISDSMKYDDHDRTKKGDRVVVYKGRRLIVESKSLQTKTVKKVGKKFYGKAQVDGSDRRTVTFADGSTLETTLLLPGEFDVLAVNCFAFENTWKWVFCKNTDLPKSTWRKYTEVQRENLLASLVNITWPPEPPFTDNIFAVLQDLVTERSSDESASASA